MNVFACLCGVRIETPDREPPRCWDCGKTTAFIWQRVEG